ncbi:hypothetical protein AAFF_G00389360 [Aldrovandia affinis]|uniref:Uncharacterized protein n=1 Tax=Aldrovandia affinis TaxID=143900 RepID=A0AAD7WM03_9TELE|nr:hypothetical protein AAFF_G00389360 [Aldrovandia affinis]
MLCVCEAPYGRAGNGGAGWRRGDERTVDDLAGFGVALRPPPHTCKRAGTEGHGSITSRDKLRAGETALGERGEAGTQSAAEWASSSHQPERVSSPAEELRSTLQLSLGGPGIT